MASPPPKKRCGPKKTEKGAGDTPGFQNDGLAEAAGEVRRGKLSGDLGGDNFTAGVDGAKIQSRQVPGGVRRI